MLDAHVINKISDALLTVIRPSRIIVFGSYARGEADADSDLDLLAIVAADEATREMLIQCRVALREALKGTGLAIDFILQSEQAFETARRQPGSLQAAIAAEGRVIYE